MRVKLRPDAHCAPVPRGVYWIRGERSFVLSGPPALYTLVDSQLDALLDGTSVDEMVAAAGDEAARPVVEHVLRALVAQDVLIDLDAVDGPLPDPRTAADHAELLSYLESNSAQPYRAFAAVRAARVAVVGAGAAADAVRRGLAGNGIGEPFEPQLPLEPADFTGAALVVLIDDCDHGLDLLAAAASLPPGTPTVPVAAEEGFALVGPVCVDQHELRSFQALRHRADGWQRSGAETPAPRPISAVLAGSLAAQAVLARLAGTGDGRRTALVVHGHAVQTRVLPLPDDVPGPLWRPVDLAGALADSEASPASPEAPAAPAEQDGAAPAPGTEGEGDVDAQEVHRLAAALTTRWTGIARWGRDLDLPQLPVCLVTAENVAGHGGLADGVGPYYLGWGHNRAAAGLTAVLAVLRDRAAREQAEDAGGGLAAAGLSRAHLLADGLLRHAGQQALARTEATPLTWDLTTNSTVRAQLSMLEDFFGTPTELRLRTLPGLDWQLVTVLHRDTGEPLATQWGPTTTSAAYAALLAATGRAQFQLAEKTAPQAAVLPPDVVGTWSLEVASERQVRDCLRRLAGWAEALGVSPVARQLSHDRAIGELPLACGRVALG